MNLSPQGLQFIERFEGWRSDVYVDVNGHRTIGYGHLMLPNDHFTTISRSQGAAILSHDVRIAVNEVNRDLNFTPTQTQFDAIIDFTFNIGTGNFRNSSALQYLNSGNFNAVPSGFLQWTDHGADYATRRRNAEINLFTNGTY